MFNHANTTYKKTNLLAVLALSAAIMASSSALAQDLPELAPVENQVLEQETELNIDDVLQEIDETLPAEPAPLDQIVPEQVDTAVTPEPAAAELKEPMAANTEAAIEQAGNIPDIPSIKSQG